MASISKILTYHMLGDCRSRHTSTGQSNQTSLLKVTGYSRARAAYVILIHNIHDEKWKYKPTFFLAKNKNEDSDLGWTADLKINLDKL